MVVLRYIQEVSNTYCICLAAAAKSTDVDHPTLITQKGDLIMEARKVELLPSVLALSIQTPAVMTRQSLMSTAFLKR